MHRSRRSETPKIADPFHPVDTRVMTPEDAARLTALRTKGNRPSPLTGTANWSKPNHPRSRDNEGHTSESDS
jgi:hypothetical protein